MSISEGGHLDSAQLAEFALGRLEESCLIQAEEHLARCETCCRALDTIPEDEFVRYLRAVAPRTTGDVLPCALRAGYQIIGEIGRGGMGVVYKARQIGLGRVVALKRLHSQSPRPDELARFRREGEAVARLAHPNIVQVFDVGEQEGAPYLALELISGPTLAQRLHEGPLPARQVAQLVETLAGAVDHAHHAGVLHRDLKPGNILLQPDPRACGGLGMPKIADFGLARPLDAPSQTITGSIFGTPGYMAPEQVSGTPDGVGAAADIYALGAIMYEALTGRPPHLGKTVIETLDLIRSAKPMPPRRLQATVPSRLEAICLTCLEKDPCRRYPSAADLAGDLREYLDDLSKQPKPQGGGTRKSNRRAIWSALGLIALFGTAAALWWRPDFVPGGAGTGDFKSRPAPAIDQPGGNASGGQTRRESQGAARLKIVSIFSNIEFEQTSGSAPLAPSRYYFSVGAEPGNNGDFDSASVTYPGGTRSLANRGSFFGLGSNVYSTAAELHESFPFGRYAITVADSATGASETCVIDYSADFFTKDIPALEAATVERLQGMNSAREFVFRFNSWSPVEGVADAITYFNIFDPETDEVVFDGDFPKTSTTTSLPLPAGTLSPERSYRFELDFSARVLGYDGDGRVVSMQGFDLRTQGAFTTGILSHAASHDAEISPD